MDTVFGGKLIYGECQQYNQTFTLAIDIVDVYHLLRNMLTGTDDADLVIRHGNINIMRIG